MGFRKLHVAMLLVMSMIAAAAFAQTAESGAITGRVLNQGTGLPGVTVEIRSANLQGVRTDVTDAQGNFRFGLLPVGTYTLTATLSGFNTVRQPNIAVGLNRTVTLEVTMAAAISETITVTGAPPVVDVTSAASGANITAQTMQSLPIARNFTAAAQVAPGTSADATGTTVYGGTGAENQYIIDGLNTTEIQNGREGKRLNVEFIQETEVMTGGLPAEYGRMTGGIINAVTKSGSNEFHGDLFGYTAGGGLQSNPTYQSDLPATATAVGDISQQYDFGANLGGYILKDRLWFFGAYDRVKETDQSIRIGTPLSVPGFSLPVGASIPLDLTRNLYAGKMSLAITSSQNLNASILGDPTTRVGALPTFAIAGTPSTFEGTRKTGGNDYVGRYSGVFGAHFNVDALAGHHTEKNEYAGEGANLPQIRDATVVPGTRTGGLGFYRNQFPKRDIGKVDFSAFFGNHQLKVGGDRENLSMKISSVYSGGDLVRKQCKVSLVSNSCPAGQVYYIHETNINDLAPGFNRSDPTTFAASIANPLVSNPKTRNTSLYLQDSWKAMGNVTVNLGVRWEDQKVGDRLGNFPIDLSDEWAPRLGVIWDPQNNGRSKAYVNYGRFYESIPMDINIRSFGGELQIDVANLSPTPQNLLPDTTGAVPNFSATKKPYRFLGGGTTPADPDLKGQYIDEYLVGYDVEMASNLSVGIKGTYRNLGRVIEDILTDPSTGDYFITNPGNGGLGKDVYYLVSGEGVPAPKPTRKYKGVELHATKRFSNNYQFFTSYVWSRLTGNYDGTFQASTGQLDPNINSAYDYADFEVNNNGGGLLSNDRTHQVKFFGGYTFSNGMIKGLDVGVGAHWYSGVPNTAQGYAVSYRNWEYYLTPRGALGRGPADWEADFHLGFPIAIGPGHMNLLLDVFNVFNRQAATVLDQRYNLNSDPACAGVPANLCNGDGGLLNVPGTTQPLGQIPNPRASATNPDFLKKGTTPTDPFNVTTFTNPRSIRFGVRFTY